MAAAIPSPMAADFPRPLPAVRDTVDFDPLSLRTSINVMITFAWSRVLALANSSPMTYFVDKLFFNESSYSIAFLLMIVFGSTGSIELIC